MLRIFGKPEVRGRRRMAVTLARAGSVEEALEKAKRAASRIRVEL
jgi:phosphoribosylglycinamide formyltransferase 2